MYTRFQNLIALGEKVVCKVTLLIVLIYYISVYNNYTVLIKKIP